MGVDQYSTSDALINELFVSAKNKSCTLDRADLKPRFGAAAAFLDGGVRKWSSWLILVIEDNLMRMKNIYLFVKLI